MSAGAARISPPRPKWDLPRRPDPGLVESLSDGLRLPKALCSVLVARGLTDVESAKTFLRPRLEDLHDPRTLVDGPKAADRIVAAVRAGETILVHGDYDVDGICATALLSRWLRAFGADVMPFVPHRLRDGYDFGEAGLAAAKAAGADLIVTADCGTTAYAAVTEARGAGIDVIITDHHSVGGPLPDALAVVNPQRVDCAYPHKGLCGTGVAYKLCELVGEVLGASAGELVEYLDLVALATVADLVPLVGENRVLVSYGLRRMGRTRIVGLGALLDVCGIATGDVTAGRLAFGVAPRINAAGRVGEAADALALLLTDDRAEAYRLAEALDVTNRGRQEEDRRTLDEALELLAATYDPEEDYGVVLAAQGWHPGVIGIVASRVVERIHRPVVMVALDGDAGRGSARSISGFDLYEALGECSQHLTRYGGHRQAAGMDLARAALPEFRSAFNAVARQRLAREQLRPVLRPDVVLTLGEVDLDLIHWMSYLGPHGMGNPGPLFFAPGLELTGAREVGDGHLKVRLSAGSRHLDAIGFGLATRHPPDADYEGPHDALFRLERNEWRGVARPQARLADLRPSPDSA